MQRFLRTITCAVICAVIGVLVMATGYWFSRYVIKAAPVYSERAADLERTGLLLMSVVWGTIAGAACGLLFRTDRWLKPALTGGAVAALPILLLLGIVDWQTHASRVARANIQTFAVEFELMLPPGRGLPDNRDQWEPSFGTGRDGYAFSYTQARLDWPSARQADGHLIVPGSAEIRGTAPRMVLLFRPDQEAPVYVWLAWRGRIGRVELAWTDWSPKETQNEPGAASARGFRARYRIHPVQS